MSETIYKCLVIGLGGIGSSTLYWLSQRLGKNVIGLEQFKLGHHNGGSQDESRIIRYLYHDGKYCRLAAGAYQCWEHVEAESGLQLVYKTGAVDIARKGSGREHVAADYMRAMRETGNTCYQLDAQDMMEKFPQFKLVGEHLAHFDPEGGLVDAALANAVHIQLSRKHGAHIVQEAKVIHCKSFGHYTCVTTTKGDFFARKVIVTSGAWVNQVINQFGANIPVVVSQEQVHYFATPNIKDFTKERFPCYIYHADKYDIYGLPIHGNSGTKVGIDYCRAPTTADTRTFDVDQVRLDACVKFLSEVIPGSLGDILYSKTCLYTVTRDREFVVDSLASIGHPEVIVCCGAGHAYKFASVLGKICADLSLDGMTRWDITGFRYQRPAVTDPNFKFSPLLAKPETKAKL